MKAPYLQDEEFLKAFDQMPFKSQYVKITVLDYNENPLQQIEGKCTGGTISINGDSSVRRTASLSFVATDDENDLTSVDSLLSINKKIKIEVGFKNQSNYLKKYYDYDKLWFPMGIFYIISPSITHNASNITVNLTVRDKMATLNGDCGGAIPASTVFSSEDEINSDGSYVSSRPTIYQIIQELVNEFGGEDLNRIFINDLDTKARQIMQWVGSGKLYGKYTTENRELSVDRAIQYSTTPMEDYDVVLEYGDDVGYTIVDFVYPGEKDALTSSYGDNVTSVLDKIIEALGNYEYFYDVDGNFIFQEIKNYLNTSKSTVDIEELSQNQESYYTVSTEGKAAYEFPDSSMIISYNASPNYANIKNDFIVWGMRTSASGTTVPIRYHLVIDSKPACQSDGLKVYFFKGDNTDIYTEGVVKMIIPRVFNSLSEIKNTYNSNSPSVENACYCIEGTPEMYTWDDEHQTVVPLRQNYTYTDYRISKNSEETERLFNYYYERMAIYKQGEDFKEITEILPQDSTSYNELICILNNDDYNIYRWVPKEDSSNGYWTEYSVNFNSIWQLANESFEDESEIEWTFDKTVLDESQGAYMKVIAIDWRTQLLLNDLDLVSIGAEPSYYYAELCEEWPKQYDIQNQRFYQTYVDHPSNLDFYLDFLDTNNDLMNFSVSNIGRRGIVAQSENLNCIFTDNMPEVVIYDENLSDDEKEEILDYALDSGYRASQVDEEIYSNLLEGGSQNPIYDNIISLLYQYTNYAENVSISCVPIYHLEPNTRITLNNPRIGLSGDYLIKSISLPLQVGGVMTLNCTKILTRYR